MGPKQEVGSTRLLRIGRDLIFGTFVPALLLFVALVLGLAQFFSSSAAEPWGRLNDKNYADLRISWNSSTVFAAEGDNVGLTIEIYLTDLNPNDGTLSGVIKAYRPANFQESAEPNATDAPKVLLSFVSVYGASELTVPIYKNFYTARATPIRLHMSGGPRRFPSDSYSTSYFLDIANFASGSFNLELGVGEQLADYETQAASDGKSLDILMERSQAQQMWVYLIAWSPMLLLFALVMASQRVENRVQTALEATVGLVALLPLRQVLVPSTIETLTVVDFILGFEFLLFIAWLAHIASRP
jgi:hypothetical protein